MLVGFTKRLPRPKDQSQQTLLDPSYPPTRSTLEQLPKLQYCNFGPCNKISALQLRPPTIASEFQPPVAGNFTNPSETKRETTLDKFRLLLPLLRPPATLFSFAIVARTCLR